MRLHPLASFFQRECGWMGCHHKRCERFCAKLDAADYYGCDCSVHDITTPGAAHADDCPMYD